MRSLASLLAGAASALALAAGMTGAHAADDPAFLDPAQAFPGEARIELKDGARSGPLLVEFKVAPGYHLYRERFAIEAEGAALPAPQLPAGKAEFDPNFNKTMTLWAGPTRITQPLPEAQEPSTLTVRYQGCADRGLCYPPQQAQVHLTRDGAGVLQARWEAQPDALSAPIESATPAASSTSGTAAATASTAPASAAAPEPAAAPLDSSAAALQSGSLLRVVGMFLLGGLLLSFTPCVLPMLPILSSIIVGQGAPVSRARGSRWRWRIRWAWRWSTRRRASSRACWARASPRRCRTPGCSGPSRCCCRCWRCRCSASGNSRCPASSRTRSTTRPTSSRAAATSACS